MKYKRCNFKRTCSNLKMQNITLLYFKNITDSEINENINNKIDTFATTHISNTSHNQCPALHNNPNEATLVKHRVISLIVIE